MLNHVTSAHEIYHCPIENCDKYFARRVGKIIIFRRYTRNSDAFNAVPRIVRGFFRQQETGTTTSPPRIRRQDNVGLVVPRAAAKPIARELGVSSMP